MALLDIDFEWRRDAKGYRLVTVEPLKQSQPIKWGESTTLYAGQHFDSYTTSRAGDIILNIRLPKTLMKTEARNLQKRIVRRGGDLTPYRPLSTYPSLFRQFATVAPTPEGILDFIARFGPLTRDGLNEEQGEDVSSLIEQVEAMSAVLNVYSRGDKAELAYLLDTNGIELGAIKTALINDPGTRTPRLQLSVEDLLKALWLQLGQTLSSGATIRRCAQCGTLFEVGPGTGRRLDAKFCSDEHRITSNSQKRQGK